MGEEGLGHEQGLALLARQSGPDKESGGAQRNELDQGDDSYSPTETDCDIA